MDDALAERLVPDEFWVIVASLVPPFAARVQGGGRALANPRAVFTAIVFVLTSGRAWRLLPGSFGVDPARRTGASASGRMPGCGGVSTWRCSTIFGAR